MALLSKSKFLIGLQCLKYFWISFHEKDRLPETDIATQQKFDQGHEVGNLAKKLFPSGIDLPENDFMGNIRKTKELLNEGKPLFEPAFMVDNLYSRADILDPVGEEWDIYEVKSGTKVKDINIQDVAFQKHVYSLAGLKIRKCFLIHINNQYVKNGEIIPSEILTKVDITEEVSKIEVKDKIAEMIEVMKSDICPSVKISKDCFDPYDCPLEDYCWGFLPSSSVFDLYRGGKKCFQLFEDGVVGLGEIPHEYKLSDKQGVQHKCEISGEIHVDKVKIKEFLSSLEGPVHYLDFETFLTAVPMFDGVRPYQQIPFQWSLDVDSGHFEFLGTSLDSREEFLISLKKAIGDSGSIVVYNQSFEIARLRELALAFPSYKDWVEGVVSRIVDLMIPFRSFSYYNPLQKGSCGLKAVYPAVVGKDYSHLVIGDGSTAYVSFLSMMNGGRDVRDDLLKYCALDTLSMVEIVGALRGLVE